MPWIMWRARSDQSWAAGAGDPAYHLGVAAQDALAPRAGIVLRARLRRTGRRGRGWVTDDAVGVRVSGQIAHDVVAAGEQVEQCHVVVGGEPVVGVVIERGVVREHEHRIGGVGGELLSYRACSAVSAPPTQPGTTVSTTANVTPSSAVPHRGCPDEPSRSRGSCRGCRGHGACACAEPAVNRG